MRRGCGRSGWEGVEVRRVEGSESCGMKVMDGMVWRRVGLDRIGLDSVMSW
jgi:hypothetical protein